jgi:calcineurin-like phosphoesterase family protein
MTVWFTADTHFGHANIIKYCNRPFLTPEERERARTDPRGPWRVSEDTVRRHDAALLDAINAVVGQKDTLWILGDFAWGGRPAAETYRRRIVCENVFLVWGNHDDPTVGPLFTSTYHQTMISVRRQDVWLCHYPMRTWDRRFHGSWSLYGHVHGRLAAEDRASPAWLTRDVGVDACDYRPVSFEELEAYMAPRLEAFRLLKEAAVQGEGHLI